MESKSFERTESEVSSQREDLVTTKVGERTVLTLLFPCSLVQRTLAPFSPARTQSNQSQGELFFATESVSGGTLGC